MCLTRASRSCVSSSPPGRPSHTQLAEGVRRENCIAAYDRHGRAGELAFDSGANAVRAPPCPSASLCIHRLPLGLARSVIRATCSRFHRRGPSGRRSRSCTAAGTETAENDDDRTSARLPGTAPACEGTGRPRTTRTLSVQGGRGSRVAAQHTLTCTSVSHGALPLLCPQQLSTARAENSMPGISPPGGSARSRQPARRDPGWVARPIISTTRRDTALREVRPCCAHTAGPLVWCLSL